MSSCRCIVDKLTKSIAKKNQPDVKRSIAAKTEKKRVRVRCRMYTHGAKKKRCSSKGCNNQVVQGGVCITHGAKVKQCSFEDCTKGVFKGGVCWTHGAKTRKQCSFKGCTNGAIQGGVCITHGAMTKRCSFEGCTNRVIKGGVCITHGAKVERKRCSFEGCTSHAQKRGICRRHSSKRIKANINPTIQSNAVTSAIPPHLLMNYEDEEEELNSWIWRSTRLTNSTKARCLRIR